MHSQPHPATTTPTTEFKVGDFVLYRDATRFWAGEPGHTVACRVETVRSAGTYDLIAVTTLQRIYSARSEYMRLLPAVDAMRDIDTAPLHAGGAVDGMTAAATAWLAQQATRTHQPPARRELPPQRG